MLLREKDKERLIAIFNTADIPIEVWAYGSRVKGGAHDGSDLDLVVRSADLSKIPMETYIDLCEKIRDSQIPILVELRDWAMLPESFHKNIAAHHEVLYTSCQSILNEQKSSV